MANSTISIPFYNETHSDVITVAESNYHLVSDLIFYKRGNVVTFNMVGVTQILDNEWVLLGTLKSGFHPYQYATFSEADINANNSKCILQVRTNGDVYIYCYGGGASITHALSDSHIYIAEA